MPLLSYRELGRCERKNAEAQRLESETENLIGIRNRCGNANRFAKRYPYARLARTANVLQRLWCGREDSNLHGIATASPSSWCVCQFRHCRTGVMPSHSIRGRDAPQAERGQPSRSLEL